MEASRITSRSLVVTKRLMEPLLTHSDLEGSGFVLASVTA